MQTDKQAGTESLPSGEPGQPTGTGLNALMRRVRADEAARQQLITGDPTVVGKLSRLSILLAEIRRRLEISKNASRRVHK